MPYITEDRKTALVGSEVPVTVGEFTFVLQQAVKNYVAVNNLSYQTIAEVSGAIHQLQRDFDQRVVEPYEQHKMVENGDVWPKWMVRGRKLGA